MEAVEKASEETVAEAATKASTREFVDPVKLVEDIRVNPEDLDDALIRHASMFVHYAVQSANAIRQFKRLKAAFDILESRLDNEYRNKFKAESVKTTEAQIKAAMQGDPRWSGAQARLIDAETQMNLAHDAKEAFRQRRDMILELARDRRAEKQGQTRVMERDESRGALEAIMSGAGVTKQPM